MNSEQHGETGLQVQPMTWLALAVDVMILIAFGAWAFSQLKKAMRGEAVEKPF